MSEADRKALGVEHEWLTFDSARLMMTDAEALEAGGYDVDEFLEDLRGRPAMRAGEPVMVPVVDDAGDPVLEDGRPKLTQQFKRPVRAIRAAAWLALRAAGAKVPYADFDCDLIAMDYGTGEEDEPGKDQPDTTDPPSAS